MPRSAILAALVLTLGTTSSQAGGPLAVDRVEPPSWWPSDSPSTITLLVEGSGLKGATVSVNRPILKIDRVECPGDGSVLFVDVTIAAGAEPGPIALTFEAGGAKVEHRWSLAFRSTRRPDALGPDDVIELVMPDRFANGDPANDSAEMAEPMLQRADPHAYHGGDFTGIKGRLPYLKDLGITAIWLTPVYKNAPAWFHTKVAGQPRKFADFHGYSPVDFYDTNPRFGSRAEYRALVDEAHRLGLKVIQDQIVGYTGPQHRWVKAQPAPGWFHGPVDDPAPCNFRFDAMANPHALESDRRGLTDGWFFGILPDLNMRDERVKTQMIQQSLWWAERFEADAIRLDTYPMVDRSFWRDWSKAQKALHPEMLAVGEAWVLDAGDLSFFQGGRAGWDGIDPGVEALFDFPLYGAIADVTANGGKAAKLGKSLARDSLYPRPDLLVTFLGNHDTPRLAATKGVTPARHRLAAAFLLTTRGIPQLTWGDELGIGGHGDDRRSIPGAWPGDPRDAFTKEGRTRDEQETFEAYRALLALRREHPALRRGTTTELAATDSTFAFTREHGGERLVVALNFGARPSRVALPTGAIEAGSVVTRLHGEGHADSGSVTVPAERAAVFRVEAPGEPRR